MGITEKTVVITGASSGIGAAIAKLMAEKGALVVMGARREETLERLAGEIIAAGGKAIYQKTDVRNRLDLERLARFALTHSGRIDVMINNAGIGPVSRFDALRVEDWDNMIDVNLRGTLYGIASVLPTFYRQNAGHIINIISTAGLKILPTMGVYAATKNAVRTLTEALRQESGPSIRVTEISPGVIATDFQNSMTDLSLKSEIMQRVSGIAIAPESIARSVAWAIEQPAEVDIGSIVIRPTAQS